MFNLIAITALICGATADGASTDYAIKHGNVEVDPVMVKIFGTNKPAAKTIFLRGGAVIAAESAILLAVSAIHPIGIAVGIGLLIQASYHFWATVHNYRSIS